MKRVVCLVATVILVASAIGYVGYRGVSRWHRESARAALSQKKAAAERQERERQKAEREKQRAEREKQAELGRTFGACQAACPKETVAMQIQELDQKVWFKCFCVLPDRIMERNVAYPQLPAEKAPSE